MEELLEKYMKQYENDLKELTDKELKNDYIGWFCYDYSIEELEKWWRTKEDMQNIIQKKN